MIVCGSEAPEQEALSTLQQNGFSVCTKEVTSIYSDSNTKRGLYHDRMATGDEAPLL